MHFFGKDRVCPWVAIRMEILVVSLVSIDSTESAPHYSFAGDGRCDSMLMGLMMRLSEIANQFEKYGCSA